MELQDVQRDYEGKGREQREGRYYGIGLGRVTNVKDPLGLCRVKAKFLGQGDQEESDWIAPLTIGAVDSIPNNKDLVVILFVDGDPNRPMWLRTIDTKSQGRPIEAMVLGNTLVGIVNFLVDQFNQLRSDHNSHVHTGASTSCVNGSNWTGSTDPPTATSASAAVKGLAADGSVVANVSANKIALSGVTKVR